MLSTFVGRLTADVLTTGFGADTTGISLGRSLIIVSSTALTVGKEGCDTTGEGGISVAGFGALTGLAQDVTICAVCGGINVSIFASGGRECCNCVIRGFGCSTCAGGCGRGAGGTRMFGFSAWIK
jgi:hypothetical protein